MQRGSLWAGILTHELCGTAILSAKMLQCTDVGKPLLRRFLSTMPKVAVIKSCLHPGSVELKQYSSNNSSAMEG